MRFSGGGTGKEKLTVIAFIVLFPAVSKAVNRRSFTPSSSGMSALQVVTPFMVPDIPDVEFVQTTVLTSTLSAAVPVRPDGSIWVAYELPVVGKIVAKRGGIVSTIVDR